MCGTFFITQDGESTWKMPTSLSPHLVTKRTPFLLFLTATEVTLSITQGAEVSKFVERHFVQELEANQNYIKGNYEAALR